MVGLRDMPVDALRDAFPVVGRYVDAFDLFPVVGRYVDTFALFPVVGLLLDTEGAQYNFMEGFNRLLIVPMISGGAVTPARSMLLAMRELSMKPTTPTEETFTPMSLAMVSRVPRVLAKAALSIWAISKGVSLVYFFMSLSTALRVSSLLSSGMLWILSKGSFAACLEIALAMSKDTSRKVPLTAMRACLIFRAEGFFWGRGLGNGSVSGSSAFSIRILQEN